MAVVPGPEGERLGLRLSSSGLDWAGGTGGVWFQLANAGFGGDACSFNLDAGLALRSYSVLPPFVGGAFPLAPKVAIFSPLVGDGAAC